MMTYAEAINVALEVMDNEEAKERLEALKVQLAKRSSGKHGMTKVQKENEVIKERIVEFLAGVEGATATEIGEEMGIKCQKASALLKQLLDAEKVERVKEGKHIRFALR